MRRVEVAQNSEEEPSGTSRKTHCHMLPLLSPTIPAIGHPLTFALIINKLKVMQNEDDLRGLVERLGRSDTS
ncbi:MAG: hypothetical protein LBN06_02650 [Prevotellaceae bacterium]|jgi:hypothetical protein|nr:hypothetical protein [Prevotellaceae bacterium]